MTSCICYSAFLYHTHNDTFFHISVNIFTAWTTQSQTTHKHIHTITVVYPKAVLLEIVLVCLISCKDIMSPATVGLLVFFIGLLAGRAGMYTWISFKKRNYSIL